MRREILIVGLILLITNGPLTNTSSDSEILLINDLYSLKDWINRTTILFNSLINHDLLVLEI